MAVKEDILPGGLVLRRHHHPDYNLDQQAGPLSYYLALADQFTYQSLEYYAQADGTNKFLRRVVWNVYSWLVPMPGDHQAYCASPDGAGTVAIHIRYFDPNTGDAYKLPAALSHEMGHAYHFWAGLYTNQPAMAELERFWERQVSSNHTAYDPAASPWRQPNGTVEDGREQFANAFRFFKGVLCTRGVSGEPPEVPLPGFEDPKAHPEWGKQFRILPETCAMVARFGVKPGSLSWLNGADGYWQFQTANAVDGLPAGTYVAQTNYNAWFRWEGARWVQFWPTYSRS